jgi:hypothetical protein
MEIAKPLILAFLGHKLPQLRHQVVLAYQTSLYFAGPRRPVLKLGWL